LDTYKRLFNSVVNGIKTGVIDNLDKLIDFIQESGNDALEYIESLDAETLAKLKNEASFNKIYEELFSEDNQVKEKPDYKKWFKEKEDAYKKARDQRKNRSSYSSRKKPRSASSYGNENPFEVLGIPRNSKWSKIRLAYVKLVKKYHPDSRPANMNAMEKKKADQELQRLYAAWEYFENNKKKFI